jgi:3(or 17)beta-hydroxysteroid dehydrogenase
MPIQSSPSVSGRVAGQSAIVSGAASGIGRATAILLAAEGARILVTDRDVPGTEAVALEITQGGGTARALRLDVTREDDWRAAVSEAEATWGDLNILAACAGIVSATPVVDTTEAEWRRVMSVNLDGVFLGCKHAGAAMRSRGGGSIVIISSASGIRAAAGAAAYATSKSALRMFAKTLALELAAGDPKVRVNTIFPGAVRTAMWKSAPGWEEQVRAAGGEEAAWTALGKASPLNRVSEPEEIAGAVLFLVSNDAAFLTGVELVIDSGYTA